MQHFYPVLIKPTEKVLEEVWREAMFAFDASVLLRSFEINDKARKEFFRVLELLRERTFIPHQAFQEYEGRRRKLPGEQRDKCRRMLKDIDGLSSFVSKYTHHPFVDVDAINANVGRALEESKAIVETALSQNEQLFRPDEIEASITDLIQNKVGGEYNQVKLNSIYEEAKARYRQRTPPGFKDAEGQKNKQEPDRYGDVILWYQLIDFAKKKRKPLIFVTDDQTDDWWVKADEQVIAPRFELTEEMASKAGVIFHMYTFPSFLNYAGIFLNTSTQEVFKAVEALQHEDEVLTGDVNVTGSFVYNRTDSSNFNLRGQDDFSLSYYDADDTFIHFPKHLRGGDLSAPLEADGTLGIVVLFPLIVSLMAGAGLHIRGKELCILEVLSR